MSLTWFDGLRETRRNNMKKMLIDCSPISCKYDMGIDYHAGVLALNNMKR